MNPMGTTFGINRRLAKSVNAAVENGELPLVLAGNCNSCIGTIGGLQRAGLGMIWFDAHGDFNTPDTTSTGYVDEMRLAMATGFGFFFLRIAIFFLLLISLFNVSMAYSEDNPISTHTSTNIRNKNACRTGENDAVSLQNSYEPTCYDWSGGIIPCDFSGPYGELMLGKSSPNPRFTDNHDGTVADNLTGLIWLKNANCFGMRDWENALLAVRRLKNGDCGPDPSLILSDGSVPDSWRLPTMEELCTLIDYGRRNPALPSGHMFSVVPSGYYWSSTTLDYYSGVAWIVYIESGTTCYDYIKNIAGHVWPVRGPMK